MSYHDLRNKDGKKLASLIKDKPTLVRYHWDKCGHCIAMEPEWNKVKERIANMSNAQVIDVEQSALEHVKPEYKNGVDGFPMIKAFSRKGKDEYNFDGPRDADTIIPWFRSMTNGQKGGRKKTIKRRSDKRRSDKRRSDKRRSHKKINSIKQKKSLKRKNRFNKTKGKVRRVVTRRQ